jgi:hypothetical protein
LYRSGQARGSTFARGCGSRRAGCARRAPRRTGMPSAR